MIHSWSKTIRLLAITAAARSVAVGATAQARQTTQTVPGTEKEV
jgi:hypothetical protein